MNLKQRRILVALDGSDHRLLHGVELYAQKCNWHLSPQLKRASAIPWGWKGDGILACVGENDELTEFVSVAKMPVVDLSFQRPKLIVPRVSEFYPLAAQLVAKHFLSRGFTRFLFYSWRDNWTSNRLKLAFVETLRHSGHACIDLQPELIPVAVSTSKWHKQRYALLAAYLDKLPKPVAIFAASDEQAREIYEYCKAMRVNVPEEVAIVGYGNSMPASIISSVDPGLENVGYHGARLLDDLMCGVKRSKSPICCPPKELVVRASSDAPPAKDKVVVTAVEFIHKNLHNVICLEDVAIAAGVSARTLYGRFVEHLKMPPGQVIRGARIERAKKMLMDPSRPKLDVIARATGYKNANSLCFTFLNTIKTTPGSFRRSVNELVAA